MKNYKGYETEKENYDCPVGCYNDCEKDKCDYNYDSCNFDSCNYDCDWSNNYDCQGECGNSENGCEYDNFGDFENSSNFNNDGNEYNEGNESNSNNTIIRPGRTRYYNSNYSIQGRRILVQHKNYYRRYFTRYHKYIIATTNYYKNFLRDVNIYYYKTNTVCEGTCYLGSTNVNGGCLNEKGKGKEKCNSCSNRKSGCGC